MTKQAAPGFEGWLQAHEQEVQRLAHLLAPDPDRAAHLVRATVVRLYLAWPQLDDRADVERTARRILVRRHCSRWSRSRARAPDRDAVPAGPGAGVGRDETEIRDVLWAALTGLTARERCVLVLGCYAGLSEHETAPALGLPRTAVRSLGDRALGRLADHLDPPPETSAVERSLREALAAHADQAPWAPTPVAEVQRSARAHARQRRVAVAAVVLGLVAAVAVPVGIGFVDGGEPRSDRPNRSPVPIGYAAAGVYHPARGEVLDVPDVQLGSVTEVGDGRVLAVSTAASGAMQLSEVAGGTTQTCTTSSPVVSPARVSVAWSTLACGGGPVTLHTADADGDLAAVTIDPGLRLLAVDDDAQRLLVAAPETGELQRVLVGGDIGLVSPVHVRGLASYRAIAASAAGLAVIRPGASGGGYAVVEVDDRFAGDRDAQRLWHVDGALGDFSPGGRYLIEYGSRAGEEPAVLDARSGEALVTIDASDLPEGTVVRSLAWQDDEHLVVVLAGGGRQWLATVGLDGRPVVLPDVRIDPDADVVLQTGP